MAMSVDWTVTVNFMRTIRAIDRTLAVVERECALSAGDELHRFQSSR